MPKKILFVPVVLLVVALFASACSPSLAALPAVSANPSTAELVDAGSPDSGQLAAPAAQAPIEPGLLAAYENTLTEIYEQVSPSVVNIRVTGSEQAVVFGPDQFPFQPETPQEPGMEIPQNSSLGSGFVWGKEGYIITNNHVVAGADEIEVTFADERVVNAEVIGTDPDSDLAVIKVDVAEEDLIPIQLADSTPRVGQLAVAIGNPFGLEGTMTVGIVSALGRSIPAGDGLTAGPVYSIPNVIQTDAPINPGNSGGVLLNANGELIGVTTAIESPVRANAGIGFVIPTSIVERVVPELIENGSFAHPFLGISGISLFPDLAEAMDLDRDQRGAMVSDLVADGPADKAGLRGSDSESSIDGVSMGVGGDVIIAINGEPVQDMDDLISYLSSYTVVNQEVALLVLRDGAEQEILVTLEARPEQDSMASHPAIPGFPATPEESSAWLGISGIPLSPALAGEMELDEDQAGILILEVQPDSPAEEAGLLGSDEEVTINGETVLIGGDVITRVDGNDFSDVPSLAAYFQEVGAGEQVTLTVLRSGELQTIDVTLGERP